MSPDSLPSVETVNDGSFHAVELVVSGQTLSLSIDGGPPKSINSLSRHSTLNLDSPLYLGGKEPDLEFGFMLFPTADAKTRVSLLVSSK